MTGLLRIKKLSKSFFYLLVQSKVPKIKLMNSLLHSRNSVGYGIDVPMKHLSFSIKEILNLKISKRN